MKALVEAATAAVQLGLGAGEITVDGSVASYYEVDGATGNQTINVKNVRPGQKVTLRFLQDGTGNRTLTNAGGIVQVPIFNGATSAWTPIATASQATTYEIVGKTSVLCAVSRILV